MRDPLQRMDVGTRASSVAPGRNRGMHGAGYGQYLDYFSSVTPQKLIIEKVISMVSMVDVGW